MFVLGGGLRLRNWLYSSWTGPLARFSGFSHCKAGDWTETAWEIIVRAARVSDTLKAELGALACQFQSEDQWLQGIRAHLDKIAEDPAEYVDYWDLENEESVTAAMMRNCAAERCSRVDKIMTLPMDKRGASAW